MKVTFFYNEHEISLERTISKTALVIDGNEIDQQKGIIGRDRNCVYYGEITNADGTTDAVEVEFISGFPKDVFNSARFSINGKAIDEKKIL